MQPGDPVIGGVALRRPAIQSPNFVVGVSGWSINQDGTATFTSLTLPNITINQAGIEFGLSLTDETGGAAIFPEEISDDAGHTFAALVIGSGVLNNHAENLMAVYSTSSDNSTKGGVVAAFPFVGNDPNFVGPEGFAPDRWRAMTLKNSWVAGAGFDTPSYQMNALGKVELKGLTTGGTHVNGTVVTTLGVGYRPSVTRQIGASADGTISPFTCVLHIATNGDVTVFGLGTAAAIGFDGLSFDL